MKPNEIQPGKSYSFRYRNSPPVTWVVDSFSVKANRIYLHRAKGKKHLIMSLKGFISLYKCHGVSNG